LARYFHSLSCINLSAYCYLQLCNLHDVLTTFNCNAWHCLGIGSTCNLSSAVDSVTNSVSFWQSVIHSSGVFCCSTDLMLLLFSRFGGYTPILSSASLFSSSQFLSSAIKQLFYFFLSHNPQNHHGAPKCAPSISYFYVLSIVAHVLVVVPSCQECHHSDLIC